MPLSSEQTQEILVKLGELQPERLTEAMDFIDFLHARQERSSFANLSLALSTPVLTRIWDNPQDAAYDQL